MLSFYLSMIETDEGKSRFEEVYTENKNVMFNFAFNILKDVQYAEDAVHDAFVSLAKNMNKISDRSCNEIRNYLIIIVKNAAFKIYNKRKNEVYTDEEFKEEPDVRNVEIDIESKVLQENLFNMIKALDDKYADVLILKYFYDMRDREISDVLGITLENVKVRLHRGKNILRKKLREENFYDG